MRLETRGGDGNKTKGLRTTYDIDGHANGNDYKNHFEVSLKRN
jgi:hypothetical protein